MFPLFTCLMPLPPPVLFLATAFFTVPAAGEEAVELFTEFPAFLAAAEKRKRKNVNAGWYVVNEVQKEGMCNANVLGSEQSE